MSDMKLDVRAVKMMLVGFVVLMAVGAFLIKTSEQSVEEQADQSIMRTSDLLNTNGQRSCKKAVKTVVKGNVYAATRTESDHMTYLELFWDKRNIAAKKEVYCKFVVGKGVVQVDVDGETVISRK
jgi:hypothetical protein